MSLDSFGKNLSVAIVGASGGLGRAFVTQLDRHPSVSKIVALSRSTPVFTHDSVETQSLNLNSPDSIDEAIAFAQDRAPFDLVVIASGLLHSSSVQPERSHRQLSHAAMSEVFEVNTTGPALLISGFMPLMRRDRKSVIAAISARVGSLGDNRLGGWVSYRASKAALNMVVRTFAIEQARTKPQCVIVALQPGTVDTPLSAPFTAGMSADKLLTADDSARHMLNVIDGLQPSDTGGFFAWDGAAVPY